MYFPEANFRGDCRIIYVLTVVGLKIIIIGAIQMLYIVLKET